MRKKHIFRILILITLLTLSLVGCGEKTVTVDEKILAKHSASETTKIYWDASFRGNPEIVKQLITKEPKDFWGNCYSENDEVSQKKEEKPDFQESNKFIAAESEEPTKKELENEKEEYNNQLLQVFKDLIRKGESRVFEKYYDKDSEFFSIYSLSHLINISEYSVQNLVIEKELNYKDESRVEVDYPTSYSDRLKFIFYLKKESNGWKIFNIMWVSELKYSNNEDYAKARPDCNE